MSRQGSRQDQLSLPESDVLPQKFDPDRQIPESGGTPQLSGSGPRNLATTGGYPNFGQTLTWNPRIWPGTRKLARNPNFGRKVRKVTPEPEISRYRPPGTPESGLEQGPEHPRNRVRNPETGRKLARNPETGRKLARNPEFPESRPGTRNFPFRTVREPPEPKKVPPEGTFRGGKMGNSTSPQIIGLL